MLVNGDHPQVFILPCSRNSGVEDPQSPLINQFGVGDSLDVLTNCVFGGL